MLVVLTLAAVASVLAMVPHCWPGSVGELATAATIQAWFAPAPAMRAPQSGGLGTQGQGQHAELAFGRGHDPTQQGFDCVQL